MNANGFSGVSSRGGVTWSDKEEVFYKDNNALVNGRNIKERMSDLSGGGEKNNDTDDEDVCDMCDLGGLCVPKN